MVVLVGSQPTLWTWLGPLLSSLVLFIAAMVTLIFTLRSTNKREWNKWRRDTLVTLCSDAAAAALEADNKCKAALNLSKNDVFASADLSGASRAALKIGTISEQLHLIGAVHLADIAVQMKEAAEALNAGTSRLRSSRKLVKQRKDKALKEINANSPGWFAEPSAALDEYNAKIQSVNEAIDQEETVIAAELKHSEARDKLEGSRLAFVRDSRRELKSTS